jgi:CBS domain-containing protein
MEKNSMKHVRDVMTRAVECARPEMSVVDAAKVMKQKNIGSLPVCEEKRVVGLITDRDIIIRTVAEGRDPASTRVADVMSKGITSVREEEELEFAERLMHDRQLRRLPVLGQGGELVGYLAMAKIARVGPIEQAGKVIKGVSQPSAPAPMESYADKGSQKKSG